MKNTIRQVFHSSKFVVGFSILTLILLTLWIYPLVCPGDPLQIIGMGAFSKPGTYVNVYDSINTDKTTLKLDDAAAKRLNQMMNDEDRASMRTWLVGAGIPEKDIDITDTVSLLEIWNQNYDPTIKPSGMTKATRNYYIRLDRNIKDTISSAEITVATLNAETNLLEATKEIAKTDYVNISDVPNVKVLPLGTDNFGRDVFKELVSATGTSIIIGLIAGAIATLIGLALGLLAGYIGGFVDDFIMFITNLFTVIPSFVLLILIAYSLGQGARGVTMVAVVIGFTSWVWTARAVRSQVISLRNRDHVNLSKLSGHSLLHIVIKDILPYIASYVVMALILQISTAILAEAQLSMLGLGPSTNVTPTLGILMNWAMMYSAHINGSWWAYFPAILVIALITFSLNLMNTGLDQVFNPTLRD